jgi:regulatory protein YycH of two-component signal transduction system YycFG
VALSVYEQGYHVFNGDVYLPNQPIDLGAYSLNYTEFTLDQLKRSLFVDPAITRNLTDWDGSQIYTDSKRGLLINSEKHWMKYSDPIVADDSKQVTIDNLLTGVSFINQHGGWNNGTFALARVPQRQPFGSQTFLFKQHFESFPIVASNNEGFGTMKIVMQKGIVTSYERSTIIPNFENMVRTDMKLRGGSDLDQQLRMLARSYSIVAVYPAFQSTIMDKKLQFRPVWAVEYKDGAMDFIN